MLFRAAVHSTDASQCWAGIAQTCQAGMPGLTSRSHWTCILNDPAAWNGRWYLIDPSGEAGRQGAKETPARIREYMSSGEPLHVLTKQHLPQRQLPSTANPAHSEDANRCFGYSRRRHLGGCRPSLCHVLRRVSCSVSTRLYPGTYSPTQVAHCQAPGQQCHQGRQLCHYCLCAV